MIYSCEVYLAEEKSKKMVIDGEGYDPFISDARVFLTEGTEVMKKTLSEYNITGISCGMSLSLHDGTVCIAAKNGTVNFVAHTKNESKKAEEIKADIEKTVKTVLNFPLEISINETEKIIGVCYLDGTPTQENVEEAFITTKEYLIEHGFGSYSLRIYGSYDGSPSVLD